MPEDRANAEDPCPTFVNPCPNSAMQAFEKG